MLKWGNDSINTIQIKGLISDTEFSLNPVQ